MSTEPTTAPDGERDAWLREALRHAPDAEVGAPARVSHAILVQARAAVAPSTPPLLAFWSWLARPPVAAGFASVMAAALVGMVWWDRPMDEAMPAPAAPSIAPVPATTATPAAPAEPETPSPLVAPAAPPPRSVRGPDKEEKSMAKTNPAAPAQARADSTAPAPADRPAPEARSRGEEIAAFPAEPVPQRSAAAAAAAEATAPEAQRDLATAEWARRKPSSRAAPAPRADAAAPSPGQGDVFLPVAEPLAPLLGALATEPAGWTRVGADGRPKGVDAALRRWLGELDAATAGRWTATAPGRPATGVTIDLRQGDRPGATLSLSASSVVVESRLDGSAGAWRAELEPAAADRLRQSLPRLPP